MIAHSYDQVNSYGVCCRHKRGSGLLDPGPLFMPSRPMGLQEPPKPEAQLPRISLLGIPLNRVNGHPLVGRRKPSNSNFNSFMWCTDRAATLYAATKREAGPRRGPPYGLGVLSP